MGMYDYVDVRYPLPNDIRPAEHRYRADWQTKSFDCILDVYIIEADGSLWRRAIHDSYEPVSPPYTGWVNFYMLDIRSGNKVWLEYDAEFVDNQLITLRCVSSGDDFTDWVQEVRTGEDDGNHNQE